MNRPTALRVRPRASAALGLLALVTVAVFAWPLLIGTTSRLAAGTSPTLLFALLLPLVLAVVLAELAEGGLDAKAVAMLGVLAALGAAIRPLGTGAAGFEPVFFLLVLGGRAFGPGFGFALGAITLFASALTTAGVGPWLPYQMLGAAWIGAGAGLLPLPRGRLELPLLACYGLIAGLLYGLALNLSFWPFLLGGETTASFVAGAPVVENLTRFLAFTAVSSLGFDVPRGVVTAGLVLATGRPLLAALRRAGRRAVFEPEARFEPRPGPRPPGDRVS